MFGANWSGPSRLMRVYFSSLPNKYPSIAFIYVDTDECNDIATKYGIEDVPSFILFKEGAVRCKIMGVDFQLLESVLDGASH